jgi:HSP20 family molecular chaperone IbpA
MADKDPSPAEDATARAKEAEEQGTLPYKWEQQIHELQVTFTVPGNMKGKDLAIEIKRNKVTAGIKGQDPIINVGLFPSFFSSSLRLLAGLSFAPFRWFYELISLV